MAELILPVQLEPFREQFLQSKLPFIRVKPKKSGNTTLWQSKVGGTPYLPKNTTFPTAPDGKELHFLAQINFEEIPKLAPFPEKGILQFYINDDDLFGVDADEPENQDTFRVLFFPDPIKDESQLQVKFNMMREYEYLPHHPAESYPLVFSNEDECVPTTDYRFYERFGQDFFQQFGEDEWDIIDEYSKENKAEGHKLGGYAYFTQDDPRKKEDAMLLLFQLDSDEVMDLMWGDMGVAHFFIREKDLIARDFSKVMYDWDCM